MRKFLLFVVAFFMLQMGAFAQTNFEELTLEKALEKSKKENKLVFVDTYTSWCMPCKYMANTIFPKKEMGDYLNERFVCVKFNTEEGEGAEIMSTKLSVEVRPQKILSSVWKKDWMKRKR